MSRGEKKFSTETPSIANLQNFLQSPRKEQVDPISEFEGKLDELREVKIQGQNKFDMELDS